MEEHWKHTISQASISADALMALPTTLFFPSGGYLLSQHLPHKSTRNNTVQETPQTAVCIPKARIFVRSLTAGIFCSQAEETPAAFEVLCHHSTA